MGRIGLDEKPAKEEGERGEVEEVEVDGERFPGGIDAVRFRPRRFVGRFEALLDPAFHAVLYVACGGDEGLLLRTHADAFGDAFFAGGAEEEFLDVGAHCGAYGW